MNAARRADLRRTARSYAFCSGFIGDISVEVGMASVLLFATNERQARYLLDQFTIAHLNFARRAAAARARDERMRNDQ